MNKLGKIVLNLGMQYNSHAAHSQDVPLQISLHKSVQETVQVWLLRH